MTACGMSQEGPKVAGGPILQPEGDRHALVLPVLPLDHPAAANNSTIPPPVRWVPVASLAAHTADDMPMPRYHATVMTNDLGNLMGLIPTLMLKRL